jgi:hypothetical protein
LTASIGYAVGNLVKAMMIDDSVGMIMPVLKFGTEKESNLRSHSRAEWVLPVIMTS